MGAAEIGIRRERIGDKKNPEFRSQKKKDR
jgi:hypothetical protein